MLRSSCNVSDSSSPLATCVQKESFDKAVAKKQAIKKQQATGGQKRKTQVVIVPKSESRRTAASTAADVSWDVIELSQGSENSQPSQGSQKLTVSQASQVSQPSQGSQKLTVSQASQVSQPSQGSQKLTVSQASPVSKELTTSQKLAASPPSQKLTASQSSQEPNAANTSVDWWESVDYGIYIIYVWGMANQIIVLYSTQMRLYGSNVIFFVAAWLKMCKNWIWETREKQKRVRFVNANWYCCVRFVQVISFCP